MTGKLSLPGALVLFIIAPGMVSAQSIERVEPPSWFTGMKETNLQMMIYGKETGSLDVSTDYPGVRIVTTVKTDNPDYLFVNLDIGKEALPGNVPLVFKRGSNVISYNYPLHPLPVEPARGFNASDVIYLLMPDRFANGDPLNDNVEGMLEKANRNNPNGRHGGDLKGISDHLGYLSDLGVTGIWLNPFLENNQQAYSYHGYSITDLYRVDPRYGTNEEFRNLVAKAHSQGIKVVMDMIFNHIGSGHWWMKSPPSSDWIHQFDKFTRTNYRASVFMDPYASDWDTEIMEKGWFDRTMPDLNQDNELVEVYLIQNSLWWIAYAGIDGIRMDTYPYPEKNMMARWAARVTEEFPGFFIVGEVWYQQEALTAYWADGRENPDGFKSNLPAVTDFPLSLSARAAFALTNGRKEGPEKIYSSLSQDFLYSDPGRNVIFLDNHDMTRFFTEAGRDPSAYRMALAFIMTTRGIPQFYYGTEILMEGDKSRGDGNLRQDFPGGWEGDQQNAFTGVSLSDVQKDAYSYTKTLLNWRKGKEVIHNGKLKHFVPDNGLYVYFRYNHSESVMVVINTGSDTRTVAGERFREALGRHVRGRDILSGREISDIHTFEVSPETAMIIELY